MARPIWSGVLTFGLVALPVSLYSATDSRTVPFHQLQRGTSDRVRNRRVNERTGKDVDFEDIVKGLEVAPGEYVVVEPEELDQISPSRSKSIEISGFVDLSDVEPIFFDRTYYLGPAKEAYAKVYKLIAEALEHADRAGISLFAMRGKEYLTAVLARDGLLQLQTMHFAEEIRDPHKEIKTLPTGKTKVSAQEKKTAEQLIETLSVDWDPDQYHDTFAEQVRKLVKDKAAGKEIAVSEGEPAEATNVVDLMEVLKRSVAAVRDKGGKGGRGGRGGKKAEEDLEGLSKQQLYQRATDLDVHGRSSMTRDELQRAVEEALAA